MYTGQKSSQQSDERSLEGLEASGFLPSLDLLANRVEIRVTMDNSKEIRKMTTHRVYLQT